MGRFAGSRGGWVTIPVIDDEPKLFLDVVPPVPLVALLQDVCSDNQLELKPRVQLCQGSQHHEGAGVLDPLFHGGDANLVSEWAGQSCPHHADPIIVGGYGTLGFQGVVP